ncbi:MAG: hypothetical protein BGO98_14570 [Myxococcales bacterium 68-20]|nr:MAG: hypothetical protein BGO98_14570 [Myxococcales bacterium 68-20]
MTCARPPRAWGELETKPSLRLELARPRASLDVRDTCSRGSASRRADELDRTEEARAARPPDEATRSLDEDRGDTNASDGEALQHFAERFRDRSE